MATDAETDLEQVIAQAAAEPARASGDEGSVDARPIGELIEADRYLASKRAAENGSRGFRISRIVPPGTA